MEIQHCKHCGGPIGSDQSFLLAPGHYVHADVRRCVLHLSARIEAGSSGATDLFCEKDQAIAALSARVAELEKGKPDHSLDARKMVALEKQATISKEGERDGPDEVAGVPVDRNEAIDGVIARFVATRNSHIAWADCNGLSVMAQDMARLIADYRRLRDSRLVLTDAERAMLREAIEFSDSCGHKDRSFLLRKILAAATPSSTSASASVSAATQPSQP